MGDTTTWLAVAAMAQTVLLAWIAAWQARAAREVRKTNGYLTDLTMVATAAASEAKDAVTDVNTQLEEAEKHGWPAPRVVITEEDRPAGA